MRRTFLRCLVALLPLLSLQAQSVNALAIDPPQKLTLERGKSGIITLHGKVQPGYHVNSNKPHEDYLIPLRLTLQPEGVTLESIEYPKPHDEKYSFSEKPLSVLTGDFDIKVHVKIPETAQPQMQILTGKLRYQACSDKACLTPKTIDLRVTVDIR